jgi:hypothetical protein
MNQTPAKADEVSILRLSQNTKETNAGGIIGSSIKLNNRDSFSLNQSKTGMLLVNISTVIEPVKKPQR